MGASFNPAKTLEILIGGDAGRQKLDYADMQDAYDLSRILIRLTRHELHELGDWLFHNGAPPCEKLLNRVSRRLADLEARGDV